MVSDAFFSEQVIASNKAEDIQGYIESDNINKWLQEVLGEDVFLLRASSDYSRPVSAPHMKDKINSLDSKRAFMSCAAIHMVNLSSIRSLKQSLYDKYQVTKETAHTLNLNTEFDALLFRPNVVIDSDDFDAASQSGDAYPCDAYCEDEIQYAKL